MPEQLTAPKTVPSESQPLNVVIFPVHNMSYPRNARLRSFLTAKGYDVTAINRGTPSHSTSLGKIAGVLGLFRAARRADVVVLSEMSLKYAVLTGLAARINNAVHVVDGFIGLYETDVEDKKKFEPASFRARVLRVLDAFALRSADIYLTDTDIRARSLSGNSTTTVMSLPVGAPKWARPPEEPPAKIQERNREGHVRTVLYYGNYIPLHGLDLFVEAWANISPQSLLRVTFIGNGDCYASIYEKVQALGLSPYCTFLSAVPENELLDHIADADVVLGIFGSSPKAQTVIANKVWQGLACGRPVLTGKSRALDEIAAVASPGLICVERNVREISAALTVIATKDLPLTDRRVADRLEAYVDSKFEDFNMTLLSRVSRSKRASVV